MSGFFDSALGSETFGAHDNATGKKLTMGERRTRVAAREGAPTPPTAEARRARAVGRSDILSSKKQEDATGTGLLGVRKVK